jgi:hypothetical protein
VEVSCKPADSILASNTLISGLSGSLSEGVPISGFSGKFGRPPGVMEAFGYLPIITSRVLAVS